MVDGSNGNLVGTAADPIDPLLGPLGDHGGPTWTMPVLAGSPAIDAGDPAIADPPTADQRALTRIVDGHEDGEARIDIGAFEYVPGENLLLARHVFYNNSIFDSIEEKNDRDAVAPHKHPLLPGWSATAANYTSYDKGIKGVMVDIAEMSNPAGISAADFLFQVGNSSDLAVWSIAPAPIDVAAHPMPGFDRIAITWPDNAIQNQWLQVTVKATENTGLAEPDIFYFGNAIGEAGDQMRNTIVNATDEIVARNFQHGPLNSGAIDDPYDYNRDGLVNRTDPIIARQNQTNPRTMLRLITAPAANAAMQETTSVPPEPIPTNLDWQYEFQNTQSKAAKRKDVEATVDLLLATDWQ